MAQLPVNPEYKGQGSWILDTTLSTLHADQLLHVFCGPLDRPVRAYLRVSADNRGVLPPDYANFEVDVYVLGLAARTETADPTRLGAPQARLKIPAAASVRTGVVALDLPAAASAQLVLVWRNDAYRAGVYDANLRVHAITLTPARVEAGQSVAFRNLGTGQYIVLRNDPRGGGALEGGPARAGWLLYQAAGAEPNNFEVKRADVMGFNWSNYDNADDTRAFIAWNHAKRLPSALSPAAPHTWWLVDLGDGTVHIRQADGQVCEVMPDLPLHLPGSTGSKLVTRAADPANPRQRWLLEPC